MFTNVFSSSKRPELAGDNKWAIRQILSRFSVERSSVAWFHHVSFCAGDFLPGNVSHGGGRLGIVLGWLTGEYHFGGFRCFNNLIQLRFDSFLKLGHFSARRGELLCRFGVQISKSNILKRQGIRLTWIGRLRLPVNIF
jgi:hypothetical protein